MNKNIKTLLLIIICIILVALLGFNKKNNEIEVGTNNGKIEVPENSGENEKIEDEVNDNLIEEEVLKDYENNEIIRSYDELNLRVKNKKYGAKNKSGDIVIDFKYDKLELTFTPYVISQLDGRYGIVNMEGEEIVPCKYDSIYPQILNGKGYFSALLKNKYGMLNENNDIIIPFEYDWIDEIYDDITNKYTEYVKIKKEGKYGIANVKEGKIQSCEYEELTDLITVSRNTYFSAKKNNGNIGVIDVKYNEIIPYKYNYIDCLKIAYEEQPFFIVNNFQNKKRII